MQLRRIKSYVLRTGRLTDAQRRAIDAGWSQYGIDPTPDLDLSAVFAHAQPLVIEIGFGMGDSLHAMAKANPQENYIGIEVHTPGIGNLLKLLAQDPLPNLKLIQHDAVEILQQHTSDRSVSRFQIYFPDPWPKKRHHKRRLIQPGFVTLLQTKLTAQGIIHCATDWAPYAGHMQAVLSAQPGLRVEADSDRYRSTVASRPATKFEQRGLRLGHAVADIVAVMD